MAKIEILVLEDETHEIELIKKALDANYLLYFARTGKEAIEILDNNANIDLAILDIYINGKKEGIEVAEYICHDLSKKCPIIFLTSATDKSTFQHAKLSSPAGYLLKPFNELELSYQLELAFDNTVEKDSNYSSGSANGASSPNQHMMIKKGNNWVKITPMEILFTEVEGRYCNLVTDKGKFLIQTSLSKFSKALDGTIFIQTHRNYIVNLFRVKSVNSKDNMITMENDSTVFLSSRLKENFLEHYRLLK